MVTTVAAEGIPTDLDLFSEVIPGWLFWGALMAIAFSWVGAPAFIGIVALVLVVPDIRAARQRAQHPAGTPPRGTIDFPSAGNFGG